MYFPQLCYAAKTWFGGFVGMMIFGASEVSRNVDLGDETTTMICKFVVRASDESITREIESDLQGWLDDITDGAVEYMPEEEVKSEAAERLKIDQYALARRCAWRQAGVGFSCHYCNPDTMGPTRVFINEGDDRQGCCGKSPFA